MDLPRWLDEEIWNEFIEHRKEIRKPMTDRAQRMMLRKLTRMVEAGMDANQCIEESILNGWQNVYPCKNEIKKALRPACHADAKVEPQLSEEDRAANIRKLHEAMGGAFKMVGGR